MIGSSDARRVTFLTDGDPDRISGGSLYARRIAEQAADNGAIVRFASVPARRYPLGAIGGHKVLADAAAGADVVVVDSLASNTLGPWMAAHRGVPLVGGIHQDLGGIDVGRLRHAVQRRVDRMAWRSCRRLIVSSESLATRLVADGVPEERITVVVPGRDLPGPVDPCGLLDLRRGRAAALLCVANWLPRKGIVDVLDALAGLDDPTATLHLVGDETVDGRYAAEVRRRLARPDLRDRVVRHGVVAPDHMAGFYAAADVFVLASTNEPYGMVYGEAMLAGVPVVGWRDGHLPHLVDDGLEGRTVRRGDIPALSAALRQLSTDEELRTGMAAAAKKRAASLPTWSESAERFFAVCHEAAVVPRRRP